MAQLFAAIPVSRNTSLRDQRIGAVQIWNFRRDWIIWDSDRTDCLFASTQQASFQGESEAEATK